ncbi:uncharacterized protein E0L32_005614 [Thyridium curvatum]|uniref:Uncharacterized protein n=1 Tax=Thyridium curvatum TaxID=1093900 RepID=A0A507B5D5_9PEZI|nr:uncharacterized protein E0L32_005614 [Thyridium curvatum]TPX13914.1 hypothetical protein E0L32_005614 [Thyridium curvatum]
MATPRSMEGSASRDAHSAQPFDIEDIQEDLGIQQAILVSLRDSTQPYTIDIQCRIHEASAKIRRLTKRLAEARRAISPGPSGGEESSNPTPFTHQSTESRSHDMDIVRGRPVQIEHRSASYATPSNRAHQDSTREPVDFSTASRKDMRKRTFSTHLDGGYSVSSGSKSRKTTPSPAPSIFSTSPASTDFDDDIDVVDLTGIDGDEFLSQQRQLEQRWGQQKQTADEDAALARLLQEGSDSDDARIAPATATATATASGTGTSIRTAYDRFLERSQASRFAPGRAPSLQLIQTLAARRADSNIGHPQVKDEPITRPSPSGLANFPLGPHRPQQHSPMPGGFPSFETDEEEVDSDDEFRRMNNLPPRARIRPPPAPPIATALSVVNRGQVGGPAAMPQRPALPERPHGSRGAFDNVPASELARRAALNRQLPGGAFPGIGGIDSFGTDTTLFPGPPSNQQAALFSRPGMLGGGRYNHLQASPFPVAGPSKQGGSLASVINRTGLYDFENLTDGFGAPLPDNVQRYVEDIAGDTRKNDEEIRELLSNIRPDMEIPVEEREGTPEELRYALYTHQQLALKWMKDMEEGSNKGGILADDMGLGKTISTLALMVSRQSPDPRVKTNLIIGPVALIKQWENEIKKKLKPEYRLSVFLYHGKKSTYDTMRGYDVVLTTYGTLAQEWKRYERYREAHQGANNEGNAELTKMFPLVHGKSNYYRVILDEAQCIKNQDTQSAKAAHKISATYRWCLTGTPMMNGVHELFSLIRFLRIRPYNEITRFNAQFHTLKPGSKEWSVDKRDTAMQRLRAVLKAIMLRRMKNSQIDGKPILNLPPKTEEVKHVVFSDDEQGFYKALETKAQLQFNKYVRAGTVGKNYSNILVLLLRLRQACCHPHLNLDFESTGNGTEGIVEEDMVALAKKFDASVVERLKAVEAFECPICMDAVLDPRFIVPCGHDACQDCLIKLAENAAQNGLQAGREENANARCPQCRGPLKFKEIVSYTVFKQVHMPESVEGEGSGDAAKSLPSLGSDTESDYSSDEEESDADDNGDLRNFVVPDDVDDDDFDTEVAKAAEKKLKRKARGKKSKSSRKSKGKRPQKEKLPEVKPHMLKQLRKESSKNREARRRYMHYLRDNWEPSAKVTKACELLENLKATGEKTIVFSLWTGLLDLLEIPIKYDLGLKYTRYDGGMSRNERDAATQAFMEDPRVKVMLVSLKAGNAGLNLTAASQVIIMDPFWNPFIEMQAVDRAHRIGQQREVQVHRILVEGTIEDRIVELQQRKRQLVEAALDEGEIKGLGRLNAGELRYLFGVRE